jgi:tetratricopeptide (TPR) repeat protein
LLLFLAASPDDAAGAPPPGESGAASAAEALFQGGVRAYDAREYGVAKELFERAYALSHIPEILFDIGLTYRALGECERAVQSFDKFLEVAPPGHPLLARARARMQDLTPCAGGAHESRAPVTASDKLAVASPRPLAAGAAGAATTDGSTPPLITTTAGAPSASRAASRGIWAARSAAAAAGGASLALGLSGAIVGMRARAMGEIADQSTVWGPQAQEADAQGRAYDRVATVMLVSAGVTALVAAASYGLSLWLSAHPRHDR